MTRSCGLQPAPAPCSARCSSTINHWSQSFFKHAPRFVSTALRWLPPCVCLPRGRCTSRTSAPSRRVGSLPGWARSGSMSRSPVRRNPSLLVARRWSWLASRHAITMRTARHGSGGLVSRPVAQQEHFAAASKSNARCWITISSDFDWPRLAQRHHGHMAVEASPHLIALCPRHGAAPGGAPLLHSPAL
jgi:hypothetical protein